LRCEERKLALCTFFLRSSLLTIFSRRLARRGGVKRTAATIYDDVRQALKDRLRSVSSCQYLPERQLTRDQILKDAIAVVELTGRQTVSVRDIIFILNRVRIISVLIGIRN
jgi:histone H3/H4